MHESKKVEVKFLMKVENLTLIEEIKNLEKRLLQEDRNLVVIKKEVGERGNCLQQKTKVKQETQDHLVIPKILIFG